MNKLRKGLSSVFPNGFSTANRKYLEAIFDKGASLPRRRETTVGATSGVPHFVRWSLVVPILQIEISCLRCKQNVFN